MFRSFTFSHLRKADELYNAFSEKLQNDLSASPYLVIYCMVMSKYVECSGKKEIEVELGDRSVLEYLRAHCCLSKEIQRRVLTLPVSIPSHSEALTYAMALGIVDAEVLDAYGKKLGLSFLPGDPTVAGKITRYYLTLAGKLVMDEDTVELQQAFLDGVKAGRIGDPILKTKYKES